MGLFTSNCKDCGKEINWFLDPPEYLCICGAVMPPSEVRNSWEDNETKRLQDRVKAYMEETGEDVKTSCRRLKINPALMDKSC